MFKKTKRLAIKVTETVLSPEKVVNYFTSAIKTIPRWYKDAPSIADFSKTHRDYYGNQIVFDPLEITGRNQIGETFKHCTPMLDAMTLGYSIVLGEDLYFDENTLEFSTNHLVQQYTHSKYETDGYIFPEHCHEKLFKWNTWFHLELPEGYSAIYMTPMHRNDLPFYTLPGVIDSDKHPLEVNTPFVIKKGFTGVIPEGTPLVQVIPFKRENWTTEKSSPRVIINSKEAANFFEFDKFGAPMAGAYKKKIRTRKIFD
jgi:hypothetical protein